MTDLYKQKRELLKQKREIRKKVMGREGEESSMQRVYGEKTKTVRAMKVEMFGSKSKKSGTKGDETSIEKFIRDILIEGNFEYKEQKRIRFLNYDFFIESANLFIEVNGDYHHCDIRLYPNGPKNDLQRRGLAQNERKIEFAEENKSNLVVIWQYDIEKHPETVKENLLGLIRNNQALIKSNVKMKTKLHSSKDWTK